MGMPEALRTVGKPPELAGSLSSDTALVYETVLRAMIPSELAAATNYVEVYTKAPERFDPLGIGLHECARVPDLRAVGLTDLYPIAGREAPIGPGDHTLRIYLAPVEWSGPEDVVVEAGIASALQIEQHVVFRLARIDGVWTVLRRDVLWQSLPPAAPPH
jgi:hypothetical protein